MKIQPSLGVLAMSFSILLASPCAAQLFAPFDSEHTPLGRRVAVPRNHLSQDVDQDGREDLLVSTSHGLEAWLQRDGRQFVLGWEARVGEVRDLALARLRGGGRSAIAVLLDNEVAFVNLDGYALPFGVALPTPRGKRMAVADYDGDGNDDVLVLTDTWRYSLLLQTNSGWQDATSTNLPTQIGGGSRATHQAVHAVDVNGDGHVDVIGTGVLLVNLGSAVFRDLSSSHASFAHAPWDLSVGDLDGDGSSDVVYEEWDRRNDVLSLTIHLNDGQGRFTLSSSLPGYGLRPPAARRLARTASLEDLDHDGDVDVLAHDANGLNLLRNDGSGTLTPAWARGELGSFQPVSFLDVDGDGGVDVLSSLAELLLDIGQGRFLQVGRPAIQGDIAAGMPLFVIDLNDDGLPDSAAHGWNDGTGHISYADLRGTPQQPYYRWATYGPRSFGDLDWDGFEDVVSSLEAANQLYVLSRGGILGAWPHFLSLWLPYPGLQEVEVADLDGDGHPDVLPCLDLVVYLSRGAGIFDLRISPNSFWEARLATADVDGDGDLDLASAGRYVLLHLNDGTGVFTDATQQLPRSTVGPLPDLQSRHHPEFLDAEGDGDPDLFLSGGPYPDVLWLNDGFGNFSSAPTGWLAPTYDGAVDVLAGDYDLDGDDDLVVIRLGGLRFLRNDGAGHFREEVLCTACPAFEGRFLASRDLDGDGDLDLFVETENGIWVLVNRTRQLRSPLDPQLGLLYTLTVHSSEAPGPGGTSTLLGISAGRAATPIVLPGLGTFRLDPASLQVIPLPPFSGSGTVSTSFAIPTDPVLVGVEVCAQALILANQASLTNLVAERILP